MGRRFSKKKGGMPSFGNRGDAGRGQRVHSLLPRSRNTYLDPRVPEFVLPPPLPSLEREVIVDIGRDEPPQPPQRSLNPSVSEFVMPSTLSAPAQVTTTTYQMGAPVLDPGASEYVAPSHIQLPPPSIRGDVFYPPRTTDLYPNTLFSNSATNIPGLPPKDPSRRWWNIPNREGGKQIKKKKYTQTRQKKQQRRHRTHRHSSRKYRK